MFRSRVFQYYEDRGDRVTQHARVRGRSGAVYQVDAVVQGSLGNLIVNFAPEEGLVPSDLTRMKHEARDIGAGVVFAAEYPTTQVRQSCKDHGVILLDAQSLNHRSAEPKPQHPEVVSHPWPDASPRRRVEDPGIWSKPLDKKHEGEPMVPEVDTTAAAAIWSRPPPQPAVAAERDVVERRPAEPRERIQPVEVPKPRNDWLDDLEAHVSQRARTQPTRAPARASEPIPETPDVRDTAAPAVRYVDMTWLLAAGIFAGLTAFFLFLLVVLFL